MGQRMDAPVNFGQGQGITSCVSLTEDTLASLRHHKTFGNFIYPQRCTQACDGYDACAPPALCNTTGLTGPAAASKRAAPCQTCVSKKIFLTLFLFSAISQLIPVHEGPIMSGHCWRMGSGACWLSLPEADGGPGRLTDR